MFGDSASGSDDRLKFGAGTDLSIFHDGTNSKLQNGTGELIYMSDTHRLRSHSTADNHIVSVDGGAVELYHNNHKSFQTSTHGAQFFAPEGGTCQVFLYADEGDDNADLWGFQASHTSSKFSLINYASGSYENSIVAHGNGSVELYHDGYKNVEVIEDGLYLDNDAAQLTIYLASQGTTRGFIFAESDIGFKTAANEWAVQVSNNADVSLFYDGNNKFQTTSAGAQVNGSQFALEDSSGSVIAFNESGTRKAFIGTRSFAAHDGDGIMLQTSEVAPIKFAINNVIKAVLDSNGDFVPGANNASDLGTSAKRWANVYTNDLNLSNEGGSNDVDGTWGSYTIQEGAEDLFLVNKRNGKKYKFNLTEVS